MYCLYGYFCLFFQPVIPMFTKNIREGYRNLTWGYRFRHWFYATTNLTFVPMYGFFPVKLKSYIGKPILYDGNKSPEMLAKQVRFWFE